MMTDFKGTTLESEGWQPPLAMLRVLHTQPRMALVHDNQYPVSFIDYGVQGLHRAMLDGSKPLRVGIVVRDSAAEFRDEVIQILREITLDEWTHPALDKIEDALLKGDE